MNDFNNRDKNGELDIIELIDIFSKWIIRTFNKTFYLFVDFVFYVKKNFILFSLIFILSFSFLLIKKNKSSFNHTTSLIVSPNFGSENMLYSKIEFYNSLIFSGDFKSLSKELNIDNAELISSISINSLQNNPSLHEILIYSNDEINEDILIKSLINSCNKDIFFQKQKATLNVLEYQLDNYKHVLNKLCTDSNDIILENNSNKTKLANNIKIEDAYNMGLEKKEITSNMIIDLNNKVEELTERIETNKNIIYPTSYTTRRILNFQFNLGYKKIILVSLLISLCILFFKETLVFFYKENKRRQNL